MFIHMEAVYLWIRQSRVCRVTIKNESIKIKLIKLISDNNYAIHFRNNSECDERERQNKEKNRRLLTENVKNTRKKQFVAKTIENVVNYIWETAMLLSTLLVYFFFYSCRLILSFGLKCPIPKANQVCWTENGILFAWKKIVASFSNWM